MYLEIFLADFAVFRVFGGISRDFAEIPEFRGFATARNIRSPGLGKTQKRNAHSEEGKPSKKGKRRSSDTVEYLKEKVELESQLRREEMDFKKTNQQMLVDQQSQMHKQQLEMMKMLQQQISHWWLFWKSLLAQSD